MRCSLLCVWLLTACVRPLPRTPERVVAVAVADVVVADAATPIVPPDVIALQRVPRFARWPVANLTERWSVAASELLAVVGDYVVVRAASAGHPVRVLSLANGEEVQAFSWLGQRYANASELSVQALGDGLLLHFLASLRPLRWSSVYVALSDGAVRWTVAASRELPFVAGESAVYVSPSRGMGDAGEEHGSVVAIDRASGRERWRAELEHAHAQVRANDALVFAFSSTPSAASLRGGTLEALDATSGAVRWRQVFAGAECERASIAAEGAQVAVACRTRAFLFDANSGQQLGQETSANADTGGVTHTTLLGDQWFVQWADGAVVAHGRSESGSESWDQYYLEARDVIALHHAVAVVTRSEQVLVFDPRNGTVGWSHRAVFRSLATGMRATNRRDPEFVLLDSDRLYAMGRGETATQQREPFILQGRVTVNGVPAAHHPVEIAGLTAQTDAQGRYRFEVFSSGELLVDANPEAYADVVRGRPCVLPTRNLPRFFHFGVRSERTLDIALRANGYACGDHCDCE